MPQPSASFVSREIDIPLEACLRLVNLGVSVHGSLPVERFRMNDLWCLHLYRYHAQLRIYGEDWAIRPGSLSIVPAGAELEYRFDGRSEHTFAHFALPDPRGPVSAGVRRVPVVQYFDPARFVDLERAMREAVGWFGAEPRRAEVRLWDLLWQITDPIRQPKTTEPATTHTAAERGERCVEHLLSAIELRLGEPLRVSELVAGLEVELSYNQVLRRFRERTGRSIANYIQHRRVTRATQMLRHTSIPIKVVAIQVGVPDLQAFNKLMRKITGHSPRALRQSR